MTINFTGSFELQHRLIAECYDIQLQLEGNSEKHDIHGLFTVSLWVFEQKWHKHCHYIIHSRINRLSHHHSISAIVDSHQLEDDDNALEFIPVCKGSLFAW